MFDLNKNSKILDFLVILSFVLIGVSFRLLSHPPNFTPIFAIILFGGIYFSRKIAFTIPILIIFISDIFIGYYDITLMIFVYGSFLLCIFLSFYLKKYKTWQIVLGGSFLTAIIFFSLTNFAVWIFTPWYEKTFSGLIQCYLMALPFFRNTLLGNFFYGSVFFGAYEAVRILFVTRRTSTLSKVFLKIK